MRARRRQRSIQAPGLRLALLLGMATAGCGSNQINEKLDAGQRKYCDGKCPDVTTGIDVGTGVDTTTGPDSFGGDFVDVGAKPDARPDAIVTIETGPRLDVPSVDSTPDAGAKQDGVPDVGADLGPDFGPDLGPDLAPDLGPDIVDVPPVPGPDIMDSADVPPDLTDTIIRGPETSDTVDVPAGGPDSPQDLPKQDLPPDLFEAPPADGPADLPPPDTADAQKDTLPASACMLTSSPWSKAWPSSSLIYPGSTTTASDGTLWVGGTFYQSYDFGAGTIPCTDVPNLKNGDGFLVKIGPQASSAIASFGFGDANGQPQSVKLATSTGSVVAVGGDFTGEIDFTGSNSDGTGPSGQTGTEGVDFLTSVSKSAFYAVISNSSSGTYPTVIKAHRVALGTGGFLAALGSNPSQQALALCAIVGWAVPLYAAAGTNAGLITGSAATYGGGKDIVVAKISTADGQVLWGKQFGGTGDQSCSSVTLDANGDVIVAGYYKGALDFHGATAPLPTPTSGFAPLFVAKLSGTDGSGILASTWGTGGQEANLYMAVDSGNNVFVAGGTKQTIDFGGGIIATYQGNPVTKAQLNAFAAKLSSTLVPQWARVYGSATGDQIVNALATTSAGDVVLAGSYKGSLGDLGLPANTSTSSEDAFIAQLSANGDKTCAQNYGDLEGTQSAFSLSITRAATGSAKDMVFVGGVFSSQIQFGSNPVLDTGGGATLKPFIARLAPQ